MRIRQVEVFHAIYVNGSISAAARSLRVSQPYVSKVLQRAQDELGFKLFELVRGRLTPTDEAHALFRDAGHVFDHLESLRRAVRNIQTHGGGHIRLAVVPSLGLNVAPRAIAAFRALHPEVTFEVQTLHHDDLFRSLYERESDLAIAYDPPPQPRLARVRLGQGELGVLFKPGDLEIAEGRFALRNLEDREVIGLASSGPVGDLLARGLKRERVSIREVVSAQTFYVAAALVRWNAGLTIVDEFTARASLALGVDFRPLDPPLAFSIQCVHLEDRPLSAVARDFVAHFEKALAEEGASARP
ncbi:HTH-type transcriptional activator CmpR [compost metagenome]